MHWTNENLNTPAGADPLLTAVREVRLPRLDLIAGIALAFAAAVVSGLSGFARSAPDEGDFDVEPARRHATLPLEPQAPPVASPDLVWLAPADAPVFRFDEAHLLRTMDVAIAMNMRAVKASLDAQADEPITPPTAPVMIEMEHLLQTADRLRAVQRSLYCAVGEGV